MKRVIASLLRHPRLWYGLSLLLATCAFAEERLQARPDGLSLRDAVGEPGLARALEQSTGMPVAAVAGPQGVPPAQATALAGAWAAFEGLA